MVGGNLTLKKLRARKIPYRDLVIWKILAKPMTRYKVRAPHVEAVRLLLKNGWEMMVDNKVDYIIKKGKGRLYERAVPYQFFSYNKLDLEYYEMKQILPVAHKVLAMFDVSFDDLTSKNAVDTSLN